MTQARLEAWKLDQDQLGRTGTHPEWMTAPSRGHMRQGTQQRIVILSDRSSPIGVEESPWPLRPFGPCRTDPAS